MEGDVHCCIAAFFTNSFNIAWYLFYWCIPVFLIFGCLLAFCIFSLRIHFSYIRKNQWTKYKIDGIQNSTTVGFFHPYCNAGGGGERVLWSAIKAIQNKYPTVCCIVYTGDTNISGKEIIEKAGERFNIFLKRDVTFVYLDNRHFLEAKYYPYFTLLCQSVASIFVGFNALRKFVPDIYMDTMGYSFAAFCFKYLGKCRVACYTHYPTISTDMLNRVIERNVAFNNEQFVARSRILSQIKIEYYKLFAKLYGLAGRIHDVIMVNSSWTEQHILELWRAKNKITKVYPPCNVQKFLAIPLSLDNSKSFIDIISISQFRPEKNHQLQLLSVHKLLNNLPEEEKERVRLILVGGCRDDEDKKRICFLEKRALELGISKHVIFKINIPFDELLKHLSEATIGIHTMWNEHFGIGIVECMAAGVIMLAHNSGGPKMDIVIPFNGSPTGFLADSIETFSEKLKNIINLSDIERQEIRDSARQSVSRFSDEKFELSFLQAIAPLFT